jgi:ABC-type sugar transport system ATPase subunit
VTQALPTDVTVPRAKYLVRGITKRFGANLALDHVRLELEAGEVHALIGENGAGKSTLLKILSGAASPDEGELLLDGAPVHLRNVAEARAAGISIVFQELELFQSLTVLANLFFGREPRHASLIDNRAMARAAAPLLARVGLTVPLNIPVGRLSLEQRQLLEIAKALGSDPRVLILDEPTSALNLTATARLFEIVRDARDRGVAVVFVSHRLEEVLGISDRITVLRDGRVISTRARAETEMDTLVSEMIGRKPRRITRRRAGQDDGSGRLTVSGLTVGRRVHDVNLSVGATEVVGLAGLEGAGHEAVIDAIFGIIKTASGEITLPDGRSGPRSIHAAVAAGIAYVPADRRNDGLMLEQSVATNAAHVVTGVLGRTGRIVRPRDLERRATALSADVKLTGARVRDPVSALSGGNQQKVLISRWLAANPRVFLLNDPTRGVDVGAKAEIYDLIARVADQGKHVLFSSTELAEYAYVCQRVYVFYRGALTCELQGEAINEHNLLRAINTGISPLQAAGAAA